MKKELLKSRFGLLKGWAWQSEPHPSKFKSFIKEIFRVLDFFIYEARQNALALRANALTYIIILSMVPVMALGTAVLKGLGAQNQMKQAVYRFVDQFETPDYPNPVTQHLRQAVNRIFEYVDRTNFATLGIIGILGLIWAVLSTLGKIEAAMNSIWKVEKARPWDRKLLDYTALTVILPLSLNLAIGATALGQIQKFTSVIDKFLPFPLLSFVLIKLLPVFIIVVTFSILYRFLPNTHVKPSAAMVGGICGGIAWVLVQLLYVKLQIGVTRYNAIYGSFATIPLFLIWLNLGWLMFLGGAQLSFVYQYKDSYNPFVKLTPFVKLSAAIKILREVYRSFYRGEEFFISKSDTPYQVVVSVLEPLEKANIVKKTENGGYLPAKAIESLNFSEIMEAVFGDKKENLDEEAAIKAFEAAKRELSAFKFNILKPDKSVVHDL